MINSQGTSFIPQRPSKGKVNTRRVRKIYVLSYISYILFFGAVLAACGVFFLNLSLDAQLEKQKELLSAERDQFNQGEIESIRELEKRINLAQERLDNHISVFSILEALEKSAVQSILYVQFDYKRLNDGAPVITFVGNTDRFDSVLFQREMLESNPVLADSTFSEVAMNSRELENPPFTQKVVSFTFEKEVEEDLVRYTPREVNIVPPEEAQQVQDQNGQQTADEPAQTEQTQTEQTTDENTEAELEEDTNVEGT